MLEGHNDSAQAESTKPILTNLSAAEIFRPQWVPNLGNSTLSDNSRLEWSPSLKDAVAEAKRQGKPLVCVFEEDYCGWCKQMDKEFAKPAAVGLGRDAVFVRLSPSTDPAAKALADNLGVKAYPTVSVLDIRGSNVNERTRITGFTTVEDIATRIKPQPVIVA
ncbi:MAG: thioredoxin family protein [Cyanobacteria bacterium SZAS LIN-3]|nr:thioredoxin family protein [Cyanobacteria bacterium SZAS LIN-3]MBS2009021.1 thioredoxin family protein [Cyanobacteria bacterium SZAS TMP-1]